MKRLKDIKRKGSTKRLFRVKNSKGQFINDDNGMPLELSSKPEAKAIRDLLNEDKTAKKDLKPYTVSRGPDHIGRHGNRVARMRLQPKCTK